MSFKELKDRGPVGRLQGHQCAKEGQWTGGPHFTTSSSSRRKEPTNSPWTSTFGLQTTIPTTTQPRPVFSPQTSCYTYKPSSSIPQRQPSTSEFYLPRSNSDLLIGTMNSRDPYAMETPLNISPDVPLPPPPPLLSGARLGAIIILYVSRVLGSQTTDSNEAPTACWAVYSSPSWTLQSSLPHWSRSRGIYTISRTCTGLSWRIFFPTLVSVLSFCPSTRGACGISR